MTKITRNRKRYFYLKAHIKKNISDKLFDRKYNPKDEERKAK